MSLKLYYDLMSQPSRALLIFLKVNKIPFEEKQMRLAKGDHLSEEFESINRFKRVPVIVDDDFKLAESIAIFRYLCREKNVPDHWYPKDSQKMARVDEFLEYQHIDLRLHCAMFFQVKFLRPLLTGKPAQPKRLEEFKKRMTEALDKVENLWLKNGPYIVGNRISIADIIAACEIEQTRMAGYDPCEGRQLLKKWFERIKKDLNPYYDEAHKLLYKIAARNKATNLEELSKL